MDITNGLLKIQERLVILHFCLFNEENTTLFNTKTSKIRLIPHILQSEGLYRIPDVL